MTLADLIIMGFSNLRRTRLRTFLTLLGVMIGIGALTSMVSFSAGMQKNITEAFMASEVFTSITVTPKNGVPGQTGTAAAGQVPADATPLNDSLLQAIRAIPGVALAYPQVNIPVRITLFGDSVNLPLTALPAAAGAYPPYNKLLAGAFFSSDTSLQVVVREEMLRNRFNILLLKKDKAPERTEEDSVDAPRRMRPEELIGKSLTLVSVRLDAEALAGGLPMMAMRAMAGGLAGLAEGAAQGFGPSGIPIPALPLEEVRTEVTICGILGDQGEFGPGGIGGAVILPSGTAARMPQLGFTNVWELLSGSRREGQYGAIHVRTESMEAMQGVREGLEAMDVGLFTMADQLEEIKRMFLAMGAALGSIGTIALLVAGLGITNTMVMSILERTREIGIMKAIGGNERQIRMVFFTEASVIGLAGAVGGIALGWAVTRIASAVIHGQLLPEGIEPIRIFYFPAWLILGALAFSVGVSLIAGLYPAFRAARIDPVRALRHD